MLHKGFVIVGVIGCICLALQILTVMSVPITKPERGLYLASYQNFTYGVFGLCYSNICTSAHIGYPSSNSSFFEEVLKSEIYPGDLDVRLPSKATFRVSKLLVVHVVSTCFTFILVVFTVTLNVYLYINENKKEEKSSSDSVMSGDASNMEDNEPQRSQRHSLSDQQSAQSYNSAELQLTSYYKKDITGYLNFMLMLTLFSFLFSLLAFLADILMFVPELTYLGWIQIIPIVSFAIVLSMLCLMKRFTVSIRYLDEIPRYGNDDMISRKFFNPHKWNDTGSDDGFIAYANGIYSNLNEDNNNSNDYNENRIRHKYNRLGNSNDDHENEFVDIGAHEESDHSIASSNDEYIELSTFSSTPN